MSESFAKRCYIDALTDAAQREKVHDSNCKTLDEAVCVAVAKESWQLSERGRRYFHDQEMHVRVADEMSVNVRQVSDGANMHVTGHVDESNFDVRAVAASEKKEQKKEQSVLDKVMERLEALERRDEDRRRRRDVLCYACQRPGHIARFCRSRQQLQQGNDGQPR